MMQHKRRNSRRKSVASVKPSGISVYIRIRNKLESESIYEEDIQKEKNVRNSHF